MNIENLTNEKQELSLSNCEFSTENDQFKKNYGEIRQNFEKLKSNYCELSQVKNTLQSSSDQLKEKINGLLANIETLKAQIVTNSKYKEEKMRLDSRLSDLNQLQDKNKETINKLTSRNSQLEKNVKDLNIEIDYLINECLETDSDSDEDDPTDNENDPNDSNELFILDSYNGLFSLGDINSKKNPRSACDNYGCRGKKNTNNNKKTHRSENTCPHLINKKNNANVQVIEFYVF
jgi:chromosome segregation ATPase